MDSREGDPSSSYRSVKALPFELVQHCGIYFEEKLYTQALNFLSNILESGAVAWGPVFVPSPPQLSLAATLLVHPVTTTRAKTAEEKAAAPAALRLLRLLNTYISPISAKFDVAFSFTHFESSRHGTRRHVIDEGGLSSGLYNYESKPLNLNLAQSESLWSRAEDFWHAVGWAFNCSVLHPERWERWWLWLQFMCETLEDDWNKRSNQFDSAEEEGVDASTSDSMQRKQILDGSLILQYITAGSVGYGGLRRILRAIFADGSSMSVNEFREVFRNELKQPKGESENPKKRGIQVNIDEDEYGDYMSDRDEDESDGSAEIKMEIDGPRRSKRSKKNTTLGSGCRSADAIPEDSSDSINLQGGVSLLGGFSSLALRQRLLQLLSAVAHRLPARFVPLEELYHLFVENIRHLPLPVFQAFVSPYTLPHFLPASQTTLCEFLLFSMRENSAPDTDEDYLNQKKLEICFLPFAASTNSVIDNAKMSIALESMLMLLADGGMLSATPELKEATQEGIIARSEKAQTESRKNRKVEDVAWSWLLESAERLTFMINEAME